MFPSNSASSAGQPLADTMDMLQPWMIAAIAGLVLLMLIIAAIARRRSKSDDEDVMNIARGEERAAQPQTARKSQAERQGTRSARGEESITAEGRTGGKPAGEAAAAGAAGAAGLRQGSRERSQRPDDEQDSRQAADRRAKQDTGRIQAVARNEEPGKSADKKQVERAMRADDARADRDAAAPKAAKKKTAAAAAGGELTREQIVQRAAERKRNRGKSKGSHAK